MNRLIMKYLLNGILLCAAAAMMISCDKNALFPKDSEEDRVSLMVSAAQPGNGTKSLSARDENSIRNITVYVFDTDGSVNAVEYGEGKSTILKVRPLPKQHVRVLVNTTAPMDGFESMAELEKAVLRLSDQKEILSMFGSEDNVDLSKADNLQISVRRHAAKVQIHSISNCTGQDFTIRSVFLINVPVSASCMNPVTPPGEWTNRMRDEKDSAYSELLRDDVDIILDNGRFYNYTHTFYCFPNDTDEDIHNGTWSPRHTRLVVETQMNGRIFYYPMPLDNVKSTTEYIIRELEISRDGTLSPDDDDVSKIRFTFTVDDWDQNELSYVEKI